MKKSLVLQYAVSIPFSAGQRVKEGVGEISGLVYPSQSVSIPFSAGQRIKEDENKTSTFST